MSAQKDAASIIDAATPLLSLIPVAGPFVGAAAKITGTVLRVTDDSGMQAAAAKREKANAAIAKTAEEGAPPAGLLPGKGVTVDEDTDITEDAPTGEDDSNLSRESSSTVPDRELTGGAEDLAPLNGDMGDADSDAEDITPDNSEVSEGKAGSANGSVYVDEMQAKAKAKGELDVTVKAPSVDDIDGSDDNKSALAALDTLRRYIEKRAGKAQEGRAGGGMARNTRSAFKAPQSAARSDSQGSSEESPGAIAAEVVKGIADTVSPLLRLYAK